MEEITKMIWILGASIYLVFMFLFMFLWYHFSVIRSTFWENRNNDKKEKRSSSFDDADLSVFHHRSMEPRPNGARRRPKHRSDEKLYELEQNPAKQ
jgi:hypothetical protein